MTKYHTYGISAAVYNALDIGDQFAGGTIVSLFVYYDEFLVTVRTKEEIKKTCDLSSYCDLCGDYQ